MDLQTISTLAGTFENSIDLQQYCDAQYLTLQKQNEQIKKLQDEISHLKRILASTPLVDGDIVRIVASTEQEICEIEIQRLKETSMQRGLTLEETKRLDLLVKNLFLSKEQAKDVVPSFRNFSNISNDTLIQIASTPEPSEDV